MAPRKAQGRARAAPRSRTRRQRGRNRRTEATRHCRERLARKRRRRRGAESRDSAASPGWCSRSCSRPGCPDSAAADRGRRAGSGNPRPRRSARFRPRGLQARCGCGGRWRWPERRRGCCPCAGGYHHPGPAIISESALPCGIGSASTARFRPNELFSKEGPGLAKAKHQGGATPAASPARDTRPSFRGMRSMTPESRDSGFASRPGMTQTLLVTIDLFALFVALLRLDREGCDRASFKPLQRDRLAGLLAVAVRVVLDALQGCVDLGDQLALAVAGAQFDGTVGLRRGAVGEIGMIDVLFLQRLQRDSRFPQDLVLPGQKLGAKIVALAVVHERLFFGGSIILQLFQGQPIFICKANERFRSRAPYIAASCDRQYRWVVVPGESEALPKALRAQGYPAAVIGRRKLRHPSDGYGGPALSIANRKTLAD